LLTFSSFKTSFASTVLQEILLAVTVLKRLIRLSFTLNTLEAAFIAGLSINKKDMEYGFYFPGDKSICIYENNNIIQQNISENYDKTTVFRIQSTNNYIEYYIENDMEYYI
jgi:hypothetical protein